MEGDVIIFQNILTKHRSLFYCCCNIICPSCLLVFAVKSPITTATINATSEYINAQSEIAEIFDNQGEFSNLDM